MLPKGDEEGNKMSIYLPSMTDEELLRHADQNAVTDLEKELMKRYHALAGNAEASERLFCAIQKFETAQT